MKQLNDIPHSNPFKVPENYFEEVNNKIITATSGYSHEGKKIRLYSRFRPYLIIAASVTGFIIISYTAIRLILPGRINSHVSEVAFEENHESIINDIDIFTLEENASSMVLAEEAPEVNNADIINYLLLDNIEFNDIYEHL
jgi:hypothetical protein